MPSGEFDKYNHIEADKLARVLENEHLWYKQGPVSEAIDRLIFDPTIEEDKGGKSERREFVTLVGDRLRQGMVALGTRTEGWNDDDRWGGKFNPSDDKKAPDTVVVHHTATRGFESFDYIDALGLLRLYTPMYRGDVFGKDQPVSSGHYRGKRQVFVGYHDFIYPNGARLKALKPDHTGFHAGSYQMNCRSLGVSFVGNFKDRPPTEQALRTGRQVIAEYQPQRIIGHREVVVKDGVTVSTVCPGDTFFGERGWRHALPR